MINHLGSGRGWKDTLPTPLVIQGGPPSRYNWVEITPITRVIRTVSHLFSAIYRGELTPFITASGAHLVGKLLFFPLKVQVAISYLEAWMVGIIELSELSKWSLWKRGTFVHFRGRILEDQPQWMVQVVFVTTVMKISSPFSIGWWDSLQMPFFIAYNHL